mmetsp:Transcript_7760/g.14762  ORF Transcript_7760/g.14762 Transcript_7760/m.14762 type:complete len:104 (-) Transcript_7760:3677-3988(-)
MDLNRDQERMIADYKRRLEDSFKNRNIDDIIIMIKVIKSQNLSLQLSFDRVDRDDLELPVQEVRRPSYYDAGDISQSAGEVNFSNSSFSHESSYSRGRTEEQQ